MRKIILLLAILFIASSFVTYVARADDGTMDGACSDHGGIDNALEGANNGYVTCNDGWTGSSVLWIPTPPPGTCWNESQASAILGEAMASGTAMYSPSAVQGEVNLCQQQIKQYNQQVAEYNSALQAQQQEQAQQQQEQEEQALQQVQQESQQAQEQVQQNEQQIAQQAQQDEQQAEAAQAQSNATEQQPQQASPAAQPSEVPQESEAQVEAENEIASQNAQIAYNEEHAHPTTQSVPKTKVVAAPVPTINPWAAVVVIPTPTATLTPAPSVAAQETRPTEPFVVRVLVTIGNFFRHLF